MTQHHLLQDNHRKQSSSFFHVFFCKVMLKNIENVQCRIPSCFWEHKLGCDTGWAWPVYCTHFL